MASSTSWLSIRIAYEPTVTQKIDIKQQIVKTLVRREYEKLQK